MIADVLSTILESFIYDISKNSITSMVDKKRQKKFLKDVNCDISVFCKKNECIYIDSSAFDYFIRSTHFLEKVIERGISTKIDKSDGEFLKEQIEKARDIANAEEMKFTNNEERLIKDLFHIVNDKVQSYYRGKLSTDQRRMIAVYLEQIKEIQDSIDGLEDQNRRDHKEIISAIEKGNRLSDTNATIIADLLSSELAEGRFKEFEDLTKTVMDKSDDISIYYDFISQILKTENCSEAVKNLARISNQYIRDNAIRIVLPIMIYRNEPVELLSGMVEMGSLKELISFVEAKDWSKIMEESVSVEAGLKVYCYTLNKKLVYEEEKLTKQIALILLHRRTLFNIETAMEELENGNLNWFSRLLISDKKIDAYARRDSLIEISELLEQLKEEKSLYDGLCHCIRALYYSVLVKANLVLDRIDDAERIIPEDLRDERPLSDYVYMIRIEKKEVNLEEVYDYSEQNGTYGILNNYFITNKDPKELILFCRKNEVLFDKDWPLFFMFLGALKALGMHEEHEKILRKHSNKLKYYYEFWNEMLGLDESKETQKSFVEACQDLKMTFLFASSEYSIIERLLVFKEYNLAEQYLEKLEKCVESNFQIKKYKAIIQQGKKNDIEAITWFRSAFNDNPEDTYVIDSLITLSLTNKRNVDKTVIDAAIKADTSRLHMLVAACYLSVGNITGARNENIRAILMSSEGYNPAFVQYLTIETRVYNNDDVTMCRIEGNTAACCRKPDGTRRWLCVYNDNILPKSPHVWNGDYHVYINDAAGLTILRKKKGDIVIIDGEGYEVIEILSLNCYFFRTCVAKMTQNGVAKEIRIPSKNGKMDIDAFNEWIVNNAPDERNALKWIDQYNNINDVPFPLYTYKRFVNQPYLQFVDNILSSPDVFIREMLIESKQSEKYILSFSALVALFKAGFSPEKVSIAGGMIMASTLVQVDLDVAEIIEKYDRDTVTSVGVRDGKVFVNCVDDTGKDYWLSEAGAFKKYCESIPAVNSEKDLSGPFFDGFDSKDFLGICDYDAISFVEQHEDYSLVTIEAFLSSLAVNEEVRLKVTSITDWLVYQKISVDELILYIKNLLDLGCLSSVTLNAINYISEMAESADETAKEKLYLKWEDLLSSLNHYSDVQKNIIAQYLSTVFASFKEELLNIDRVVLHILINNLLLLRKQKINVLVDEEGSVSVSLVNSYPDGCVEDLDDN